MKLSAKVLFSIDCSKKATYFLRFCGEKPPFRLLTTSIDHNFLRCSQIGALLLERRLLNDVSARTGFAQNACTDVWKGEKSAGNFGDALTVSSSFEIGGEEGVENCCRFFLIDKTTGHDQNVGVVVLTRQGRNFGHPAQGGAYVRMLIERHGDAFAAATNCNTAFALFTVDGAAERMTEIGIITGVGRMSSEIDVRDAALV